MISMRRGKPQMCPVSKHRYMHAVFVSGFPYFSFAAARVRRGRSLAPREKACYTEKNNISKAGRAVRRGDFQTKDFKEAACA